jgi:hypothetical protein
MNMNTMRPPEKFQQFLAPRITAYQEIPSIRKATTTPLIGMKVERKVSDFSAEKWKWNENMETEMEFCKAEAEMEFFWQKH